MNEKNEKLKRIPVVVRLYPQDVHKADLMRELKIDSHNLDKELLRQPARYAFWSSLYSTVAARVSYLQERVNNLEAKLFIRYAKIPKVRRVSDIKFHVVRNPEYQELRARLRRWQDSERVLKYAERAFQQRLQALMGVNANRRAEKKAEGFNSSEED